MFLSIFGLSHFPLPLLCDSRVNGCEDDDSALVAVRRRNLCKLKVTMEIMFDSRTKLALGSLRSTYITCHCLVRNNYINLDKNMSELSRQLPCLTQLFAIKPYHCLCLALHHHLRNNLGESAKSSESICERDCNELKAATT